MKKLKILLYGDQNLNILDGSAIWLSSLANILSCDPRVQIDILLKTPIKRDVISSNIKNMEQIQFLNPFELFSQYEFQNKVKLVPADAAGVISLLEKKYRYNVIITRGKDVTNECLEFPYSSKLIPYITDFSHQREKVTDTELEFLNNCYETFPYIFVQTPLMRNYLSELLKVDQSKFILLPPTIPDLTEKPHISLTDQSFVYAGKFSKLWGTENLLNSIREINEHNSTVVLNIAGDKFQADLNEIKSEMIDHMQNTQYINWIGGVTRNEALQLINNSDVGFAYRSEEIDHDNSLEFSTKVLEYGAYGKPVIVRRTKPYEEILGKDYPLFVDDDAHLTLIMLKSIENEKVYHDAAERCYQVSLNHQVSRVSKEILSILWSFNTDKIKILFAGHDFKFLNAYIDHIRMNDSYDILIDEWHGHSHHDELHSKQCLEEADIIFCEWGLGNLEYYSNNILKEQRLITRLHRQEIEKEDSVIWENVNDIIVVSAHMFEEFSRRRGVPRSKMTVIPNMVDFERFSFNMNTMNEFNLGLLGMLPKLKRPDRALDIFEELWLIDNRYKLFIKSRMPEELPWLINRTVERVYYEEFFKRIENAEWKNNVIFEEHNEEVEKWFNKIGYILSTSDTESFHLAPIEGVATGCIPIIFNWEGANTIYPKEVIVSTITDAVHNIRNYKKLTDFDTDLLSWVNNFKQDIVFEKFDKIIIDNLY